jgi:hypothetical protein
MRDVVPDSIDPVVGWRVWDVVELDGALRLCSLAFWSIWLPRCEATATCRRGWVENPGALAPHSAPAERCTCGLYATRTVAHTLAYSRGVAQSSDTVHRVVGRVTLWGTVVEAEAGWRASLAYPAALYVPTGRRQGWRRRAPTTVPAEHVARGLRDYGVPVELVNASTDRELAATLEPRRPKP